jgi:glycosyltransferase involved in cell wall biosynthesis
MDEPKISVVMPCYNHGEFVAESVASVMAAGRDDLELIVVDDGSTDERTQRELDALADQSVTVTRQKNGGVGAARNAAIRASRGQYIFPLDADDLLRPGWISRAIEILDSDPRAGIVYGDAQFFGARTERWNVGPIETDWLLEKNYIPVSALFRRTVWHEIGGYDCGMPVQGYEDWDFWLSALERGWEFVYLPEVFFDYRKSAESMLTRAEGLQRQVFEYVAKKHGVLCRQTWQNQVERTKSVRWMSRQLGTLLVSRAKAKLQKLVGREGNA